MDSIITIVIPVYNRREIVTETLKSVAAQAFRPIDVILVDNASTDGSLQVLRGWKESLTGDEGLNVSVVCCDTPGAAAARNAGLRLVKTPWVMFFDSDDTMSADHVALAVDDINEHRDADVIGWDTTFVDRTGKVLRHSRFHVKDVQWRNIFNGSMSTQHYCASTDLVRKVGGWDEKIGYWDDMELACRIVASQPKIVCSKRRCNRVRVVVSEVSITNSAASDPIRTAGPAISAISSNVGLDDWLLLKLVIEAAGYTRAGSVKGDELYRGVVDKCDSGLMKMKLWVAYKYTAAGGRGIAAIYRKLGVF